MGIWTVKIAEATQRGELPPDIDIIECAEQFVYLFYGQAMIRFSVVLMLNE